MTKRMLIDATHPEETRVVVMNGDQLEDFDFETATKHQLKGNIYLAKVTRVEPSLQAAFIEYGGNRHGFLAFSEIHPDYFQIPQADRDVLEARENVVAAPDEGEADPSGEDAETVGGDAEEEAAEAYAELAKRRARLLRSYKIQEVIKRRQILLVQVVKEERGNKGAALTTYLSNAGRYCVLMPNTPRGGGISRKITSAADRSKLKKIAGELEVPEGMGLIIRTAGQERTRAEIRRDYDYLLRLWSDIRDRTLRSVAPCLIHEEASLIKRAVRDLYSRDIEEVLVEGDEGYRTAKRFMNMIMPSRSRHVKPYKDETPLFHRYGAEDQLDQLYDAKVNLPSGGTLVINATEALTAIDVNSGRSTKERHIEETAFKTNLEAADEVGRQLRLRDLAGLVVIDFIDMADGRNQRSVERRLRDALKVDRARVQLGKISTFGLMELSRQRLRPSFQELSTQHCPVCAGLGAIRSTEGAALQALRQVEREGLKGRAAALAVALPIDVALYILNQKRDTLIRLETRYGVTVRVEVDPTLIAGDLRVAQIEARTTPLPPPAEEARVPLVEPEPEVVPDAVEDEPREAVAARPEDAASGEEGEGRKRRRRRRRRGRGRDDDARREPVEPAEAASAEPVAREPDEAASPPEPSVGEAAPAIVAGEPIAPTAEAIDAVEDGRDDGRKRRRRRRRRRDEAEVDSEENALPVIVAPVAPDDVPAADAPFESPDAPPDTSDEEAPRSDPLPAPFEAPEPDPVPPPVDALFPEPDRPAASFASDPAEDDVDLPPPVGRDGEGARDAVAARSSEAAVGDGNDAPAEDDDDDATPRRGWWSRWVPS